MPGPPARSPTGSPAFHIPQARPAPERPRFLSPDAAAVHPPAQGQEPERFLSLLSFRFRFPSPRLRREKRRCARQFPPPETPQAKGKDSPRPADHRPEPPPQDDRMPVHGRGRSPGGRPGFPGESLREDQASTLLSLRTKCSRRSASSARRSASSTEPASSVTCPIFRPARDFSLP